MELILPKIAGMDWPGIMGLLHIAIFPIIAFIYQLPSYSEPHPKPYETTPMTSYFLKKKKYWRSQEVR